MALGISRLRRAISIPSHVMDSPVEESENFIGSAVEMTISPKEHSVGGLVVRRSVPTIRRRSVGPFVFVDQMGPLEVSPQSINVAPHPHIGIATLTYLLEGSILHRDTTSAEQVIEAGAVNWMTAGRGIVHSEKVLSVIGERLHGLQFWIALPAEHEETEPKFEHYPMEELPLIEGRGTLSRVVVGRAFNKTSPVQIFSPTLLLDLRLEKGASLELASDLADERAVYLIEGSLQIGSEHFSGTQLIVLKGGVTAELQAGESCRALVLGGKPFSEGRFMDWNFVSTSRARIQVAKADYRAGRLGALPEDGENLPLPEDLL